MKDKSSDELATILWDYNNIQQPLEKSDCIFVLGSRGSGKIVVEGKEYQFNEGDIFLINPGEKYYFEGNTTLFMPCTPAWYPEQH